MPVITRNTADPHGILIGSGFVTKSSLSSGCSYLRVSDRETWEQGLEEIRDISQSEKKLMIYTVQGWFRVGDHLLIRNPKFLPVIDTICLLVVGFFRVIHSSGSGKHFSVLLRRNITYPFCL